MKERSVGVEVEVLFRVGLLVEFLQPSEFLLQLGGTGLQVLFLLLVDATALLEHDEFEELDVLLDVVEEYGDGAVELKQIVDHGIAGELLEELGLLGFKVLVEFIVFIGEVFLVSSPGC